MSKPRRKPVPRAGRQVKCAKCNKPHVSDGLHRECVACRPAPAGQQADCHRCKQPHISNGVNVNCQGCRDYFAACKRLNRGGQRVTRSRVNLVFNKPVPDAKPPPLGRAVRELLGAASATRSMQPPAARSSPVPDPLSPEQDAKSSAVDVAVDADATIPLPERLPSPTPPDDAPADAAVDVCDDLTVDAPVDRAVDAPADPMMTARGTQADPDWPMVVWQPGRADPDKVRREAAAAFLAEALDARPPDAAPTPTREARALLKQLRVRKRPKVTLSDTIEAYCGRPLPASVKRDLDAHHPSWIERAVAHRWRTTVGAVTHARVQLGERLAGMRRALGGLPQALTDFIDDKESV